ncbi:MAG: DUF4212 domain-containing protein, partial [Oscillochloris sp.]|nr:DUF4212 domain-containing protein [Oscillochloris sp.]
MWVLNKLFPPIERARDTRASVLGTPSRAGVAPPAPPAPAPPVAPVTPSTPVAPAWLGAYWRANLRLIGPYLVIWLLSFTLPALLAQPLNQISILTGFPLGYYMGSQGSLIIFIMLTFLYGWRMRRLDRQYQLDLPISPDERAHRKRLLRAYIWFIV